jgi:hypothetical protein
VIIRDPDRKATKLQNDGGPSSERKRCGLHREECGLEAGE